MPFTAAARDGVLTLTLDTPGSAINVFNRATAEQLVEILAGVTAANTRAVVFESAKPGSFINGVGLLLAQASQTAEDTERASLPAWAAYRAVHDCPVPTIAVVQGSCFGCGVEFVLQCDYRIAVDTAETSFYMTELNDYLFIPLFGGTWNLPEAVGLEHAVDLLLWGRRWNAAAAYAHGLVDEEVAHRDRAARVGDVVARVVAGEQPSRRRGRMRWSIAEDAIVDRARARIAALPPLYHEVYTHGLELLIDGARQSRSYLAHQREELRHATTSALSPLGKAAYAFFYLRQMAGERAAGRPGAATSPLTLRVDGDGEAASFAADLRARPLPGVACVDDGPADFHLIGAPSANGRGLQVSVQAALAAQPASAVALYAPTYAGGGRVLELATLAEADAAEIARLARALQRFGFEVARTTPGEVFVSNRLIVAFLAPILRQLASGRDIASINGALRAAGFVRRPGALANDLAHAALAAELAAPMRMSTAAVQRLLAALAHDAYVDAAADDPLLDALCLALLAVADTARAQRAVRDPSIVDLLARELLDFPRHLCSLCAWLKRDRVARALDAGAAAFELVDASAVDAARAFVATGREFYR